MTRERAQSIMTEFIKETYVPEIWSYFYTSYQPLVDKIESAFREERAALQAQLAQVEAERDHLRARVDALTTERDAAHRVAREERDELVAEFKLAFNLTGDWTFKGVEAFFSTLASELRALRARVAELEETVKGYAARRRMT